ncbi:unnamed protein product [Fusarium graminearum]|nr:unnamed protein product [Fusarium graminearum]
MIKTEGERGGERQFLNIRTGGEDRIQRGLGSQLIRRARGQPLREQFGQLEHLVRPLVSRCVADQQEAVKLGASKRVDISEEREGLNAKKRDTDGGTWIIGVGPKSEMAERSLSRTWGPGPGDGQEGRRGSRFDRCSVVDVAVGYVHPLLVSWDPRLDPRELQRDEHWKEAKWRVGEDYNPGQTLMLTPLAKEGTGTGTDTWTRYFLPSVLPSWTLYHGRSRQEPRFVSFLLLSAYLPEQVGTSCQAFVISPCWITETVARYDTRFPGTLTICVDDTTTARFPVLSCASRPTDFLAVSDYSTISTQVLERLWCHSYDYSEIVSCEFTSHPSHYSMCGMTTHLVMTGDKTCLENSFLLEEWRMVKLMHPAYFRYGATVIFRIGTTITESPNENPS